MIRKVKNEEGGSGKVGTLRASLMKEQGLESPVRHDRPEPSSNSTFVTLSRHSASLESPVCLGW